jgi:hypothetical protein
MHGVVVVYDIANRATFDNVTAWVEEMQKYALIANENSRRDWCNTNTQHQVRTGRLGRGGGGQQDRPGLFDQTRCDQARGQVQLDMSPKGGSFRSHSTRL